MKKLLMQRQIDTLYHFTQAKNLINIFRYGLLPRDFLEKKRIESYFNDDYRYDNCLNAVCMSLEFPNYRMFYKLRQDNSMSDWVVLKLSSKILCDFMCAYCWTNAGDSMMYNIPIQQRMGKSAFLELFKDYPNYPSREELGIPDYYPTNPQAEILVFDTIPVNYIHGVYFENKQILTRYKADVPDSIDIGVDPNVFLPREDWKFWQN